MSGYETYTYAPYPLKIFFPHSVIYLGPLKFLPVCKRIRYVGVSFVAAELLRGFLHPVLAHICQINN